jgi:hypothetical protein
MRCDELRRLLDDDGRGPLAPSFRATIEEHLAGCPQCSREHEAQQRLRALVEGLPREIAPSRDLWPALAGRLGAAPKIVVGRFGGSRRWWRLAAAAAMVMLAAGALLVAYSIGRQHSGTRAAYAPPATPLAVPAGLAETSIAEAEVELVRVRRELLAALDARRGTMSPATQRVVDDNLRLIDGAIERISAALANDPWNPRLANRLAGAYRAQIELLQRATALPAEI